MNHILVERRFVGGPERAERACTGDRLVICSHYLGEPRRDAEILEVLGEGDSPPYRVRWEDDGHESIVYPGPDAFVEHLERTRKRRPRARR